MALPPNFSHWEHLQDTIRREHNKTVARYFRDLGGTDWEPTIGTSRPALRTAVTINDKDTDTMTLIRLYLFYEVLGYGRKGLGRFFGIPADEYEESVIYKPQVVLYFSQDKASVPEGKQPVEAEISFRLVNENSSTMTPVKAKSLANQIKQEMIEASKGFVFTKGKTIVSYKDKKNGYELQIYSSTELEGETVIKKILAIRNHVYDNDLQKLHTPKRNSINNPTGTELVYGRQRPKKRWRPTANVRFRYAYLNVWGVGEPVYLVDTTSYHFDALVRV